MFTTRPVMPADLDLVCAHREKLFRDSGRDPAAIARMAEPFRAWLAPRLADGSYFGWIVEQAGEAVAGLGMMVIDWPPHPMHPGEHRRGYILNVFVEAPYRRRGLAGRLMTRASEEGRRRGVSVLILHATAEGRPLYERLGWKPLSEMALVLE